MNRYRKLVNNSLIFAVGNFGSKLMQFVMVPLYSYTLTTSEFGKTDIITTMVSLLSPLIGFEIFDGVFRFAMDKRENKSKVLSTGLLLTIFVSIIAIIVSPVLKMYIKGYYINLTTTLLICTLIYSLISNYIKAIGYSKRFAVAGIVNTFIMVILNVVLLYYLKLGVFGYLMSMILGLIVATIYLLSTKGVLSNIRISMFDKALAKRMLIYSIPLIPNALSWWLNSASDRMFILAFVGVSANGLYAMANKIPNALNMVNSIFFQSWQISAIEEYENSDAEAFISEIFELFISLLVICSVIILILIKPLFWKLINHAYYSGWRLTPIILWSLIYSSLAGFLGTIYTANKRTNKILLTTAFGAIVNVVASIALIHLFNIYGAALANTLSFFGVLALRYYDLHADHKVNFNTEKVLLIHIVYLGYSLLLLTVDSYLIVFVSGLISILTIFLLSNRNIKKIMTNLRKDIN